MTKPKTSLFNVGLAAVMVAILLMMILALMGIRTDAFWFLIIVIAFVGVWSIGVLEVFATTRKMLGIQGSQQNLGPSGSEEGKE